MNVRDNLAAGKYENKVQYSVAKIPPDEKRMTVREAREFVEAEKKRDRDQRNLHRAEDSRINAQVCADLEIEHGVVGHPKAGKLWSLAWEHGHSSGYGDVIHYYENFVELLK